MYLYRYLAASELRAKEKKIDVGLHPNRVRVFFVMGSKCMPMKCRTSDQFSPVVLVCIVY